MHVSSSTEDLAELFKAEQGIIKQLLSMNMTNKILNHYLSLVDHNL